MNISRKKRRLLIKNIIKRIQKTQDVVEAAKHFHTTQFRIFELIYKEFNCKHFLDIFRVMDTPFSELYTPPKKKRISFTSKLDEVREAYEKYGSLRKAGKKLGISGERVRQILMKLNN